MDNWAFALKFEKNMENGAFAPLRSNASFFHNICKYMIFQRRQKALLRIKGEKHKGKQGR